MVVVQALQVVFTDTAVPLPTAGVKSWLPSLASDSTLERVLGASFQPGEGLAFTVWVVLGPLCFLWCLAGVKWLLSKSFLSY